MSTTKQTCAKWARVYQTSIGSISQTVQSRCIQWDQEMQHAMEWLRQRWLSEAVLRILVNPNSIQCQRRNYSPGGSRHLRQLYVSSTATILQESISTFTIMLILWHYMRYDNSKSTTDSQRSMPREATWIQIQRPGIEKQSSQRIKGTETIRHRATYYWTRTNQWNSDNPIEPETQRDFDYHKHHCHWMLALCCGKVNYTYTDVTWHVTCLRKALVRTRRKDRASDSSH